MPSLVFMGSFGAPFHELDLKKKKPKKPKDRMTLNCLPDGSADELICVPMS